MILTLLLLLQLKVPDAATFVGPPQGTPLAGQQLTQRTHEVAALLRCPVCQGMAVADSPAEMAVNMKAQVHELLARGYTEEQILKYFELSYGQFVLLRPKFEGVNRLVWLLPVGALLLGVAVVFFKLRKPPPGPPEPPIGGALEAGAPSRGSEAQATPAATDDPYLARVRDLVSGDKS